jgi:methanogenic corrinoid protein MtbC1
MSKENFDFSMLDDERFDDLIYDAEVVLSKFLEEVLDDVDPDEQEEVAEQMLEEAIGYISVFLAAFDGAMMSTSKDSEGNNVYELRLTMPASNLEERIRHLVAELDKEEFD